MSKSAVIISYAQSLLWIAILIALTIMVLFTVELIFVDFIHGNPHRTRDVVISMMLVQTPLFGVIAVIGALLVFTLPQFFQAALIGILNEILGSSARSAALAALPLAAVLTWYCYDYLTPSDFALSSDSTSYEHGISSSRYLMTLAYQAPISLFAFLYFEAGFRGFSRKPVIIAAAAVAIIIGVICGHGVAENQYQFLQ
jgi:hypothetical protein